MTRARRFDSERTVRILGMGMMTWYGRRRLQTSDVFRRGRGRLHTATGVVYKSVVANIGIRLCVFLARAGFRVLNASIQRALVLSVCAMLLVGCGPNAAAPAPIAATPAQSGAPSPSTSDRAVPPTLRSTIASTLKVDESRVVPAAAFAKDLGADELSMVELVMAYERVFKVEIPDADADRFEKVQDVIDYLRRRDVLR